MMTYYRRRLPHWQPSGRAVFITWRLHGSLPRGVLSQARIESAGQAFVHCDRILDGAHTGPLWLKEPRIAESIFQALQMAHREKVLRLHAYVLMANHVHVLIDPLAALSDITHRLKGGTARQANLILHRTGEHFWQDESFDHWVRGPTEWQEIREYIEANPVNAGLVAKPEDWPWSSASRLIE